MPLTSGVGNWNRNKASVLYSLTTIKHLPANTVPHRPFSLLKSSKTNSNSFPIVSVHILNISMWMVHPALIIWCAVHFTTSLLSSLPWKIVKPSLLLPGPSLIFKSSYQQGLSTKFWLSVVSRPTLVSIKPCAGLMVIHHDCPSHLSQSVGLSIFTLSKEHPFKIFFFFEHNRTPKWKENGD